MTHFKKGVISCGVALATLFATGCNDTNYELGSNYLPESQDTQMGELDILGTIDGGAEKAISTKLYRTNRIAASRGKTGVLGLQRDEVFGERRSAFFGQYTPEYSLEKDGFGYKPFVDSVVMFIKVNSYSGDTTQVQKFNVYEVVDDSFLLNSRDTLFGFDYEYPEGAISSEPVFSFNFPDYDNGVFMASGFVKAHIEAAGEDLLDRLMLKEGRDGTLIDYKYYSGDYDFRDFASVFKGLYIEPVATTLEGANANAGATFSFDLASTGFGLFGRNREQADDLIIADTIGMSYLFNDSYSTKIGGVSLLNLERDYSSSTAIDESEVTTNDTFNSATTSTIRVEGLGGIATQIVLEPALFEEFESILANAEDGYTTLFFNIAQLRLYSEYSTKYDAPLVLGLDESLALAHMPSRLVLYRDYSTYDDSNGKSELESVADYDSAYEFYYSSTSAIDGYFNRSLGCYLMNIPLEMQTIWSDYCEARDAVGGDPSKIDWQNAEWNKLVVAPASDNLLTTQYASLQGEADGVNPTPIRLKITYTLLKGSSKN